MGIPGVYSSAVVLRSLGSVATRPRDRVRLPPKLDRAGSVIAVRTAPSPPPGGAILPCPAGLSRVPARHPFE